MMDHPEHGSPAVAAGLARRVWLVAAIVVALVASCQQAPDFRPYLRQATELVRGAAPTLERLTGRLPELTRRAGALAGEGAAELSRRLADDQRAAALLRLQLGSLPAKLGSAMKTGKIVEVERTLALARKEIENGLVALRAALDATTAEVARVEAEQAPVDAAAGAAAARPARR